MDRNWSGPGEHREVVEIGAVRVQVGGSLESAREFSRLVIPAINPKLSDYFIALTGISQTELETYGQPFAAALEGFRAFADGADLFCSYGDDGHVLAENCDLYSLEHPPEFSRMHNIRSAVKKAYGLESHVSSSDLPSAVGKESAREFKAHRALDDALAVATALLPLFEETTFKVA